MSRKSFQHYGELSKKDLSPTVIAGRYRIHEESEPYLIRDVIEKLDLNPSDLLLEIGCGPGNLLIPLSFMVKNAIGIDHPNVIECLSNRFNDQKIQLIGINFLDYKPEEGTSYHKILINSVMATLENRAEAMLFIEKASNLLKPGGRLLIGDIANSDRKNRFMQTQFGQDFDRHWKDRMSDLASLQQENQAKEILAQDKETFSPDDAFILDLLRHYRRPGWEAYCLPQPHNLPFGYTREDVLIFRLPE